MHKVQMLKESAFNEHAEFFEKHLSNENRKENFFYFLRNMDEKNLLDEEIEIRKKTEDLLQFYEDKKKFNELKEKELSKLLMNNYFMYPFVERHPLLKKKWIENHQKYARYDVDMNDVI